MFFFFFFFESHTEITFGILLATGFGLPRRFLDCNPFFSFEKGGERKRKRKRKGGT